MYEITLSDSEVKTLGWLANHGYWPTEAYEEMALRDDQTEECDEGQERVYTIPIHAAWSILDLADDDPAAFLSCTGPSLQDKCIELWQSIT